MSNVPDSYYDLCARLGCEHYRCEHGFGKMRVEWAANPAEVGKVEDWGLGCANEGCTCAGFVGARKAQSLLRQKGKGK